MRTAVYNDLGQQTHSDQEHGGLVNTSTAPKVEYSYANGFDSVGWIFLSVASTVIEWAVEDSILSDKNVEATGNMVCIPNPPATTTGTTPAWNPFTESQWNSFTEAQWNAFTLDSGTVPTQLSARYDAWNRLVEIRNGATTLVENVYDARGYRIRKDTYVTGTLSESRHYAIRQLRKRAEEIVAQGDAVCDLDVCSVEYEGVRSGRSCGCQD